METTLHVLCGIIIGLLIAIVVGVFVIYKEIKKK